MKVLVPVEIIEKKILLIRGEKVMLDADLAEPYEVETFNLNKAVTNTVISKATYMSFPLVGNPS